MKCSLRSNQRCRLTDQDEDDDADLLAAHVNHARVRRAGEGRRVEAGVRRVIRAVHGPVDHERAVRVGADDDRRWLLRRNGRVDFRHERRIGHRWRGNRSVRRVVRRRHDELHGMAPNPVALRDARHGHGINCARPKSVISSLLASSARISD